MLDQINGLHHITSIAGDPAANNRFFTDILGLRRVKKTVNFDAPDVYHLYYGDEVGTPGSVMTYFPFPGATRGKGGTGEVGETRFAVPEGSLAFWQRHLEDHGVADIERSIRFDEQRLAFRSNDGESFALVEKPGDERAPWTGNGIAADHAIRGFESAAMRIADDGATAELMRFMGYREIGSEGGITRFEVPGDGPARLIDIETLPSAQPHQQGAGSVHHIAFSVDDRDAQLAVREQLTNAGMAVTPVIDRDYFWAIYFRAPGGVLFEIATNEPGFDRDEDRAHLGETLKLPSQHEHLRARLEEMLPPVG